ncbi:MAG: ParB/RepB/Spo0J family partition protein [Pirellulaceae bacterium]|nr:ParB/RepB/Spo0J family partition protein [Pirellulaceae bacterium]
MDIVDIPVDQITPGPLRDIDQKHVDALAASIKDVGLNHPISVVRLEKGYRAAAGNHRLAAFKQLGLATIPCRVLDTQDPASTLRISCAENAVRKQMTFTQTADVVKTYAELEEITKSEAAKRLHFSQSFVSKCIKAEERLTPKSKKLISDAKLGDSLAYMLSQETEPKAQELLVEKAIKENWTRKDIEAHFRAQRSATVKFDYCYGGQHLSVDVPKDISFEDIVTFLRGFVKQLSKHSSLTVVTAARVIKEQCRA